MDFSFPASSERFREELRRLLASREIEAELVRLRLREDDIDGDARPLYRLLGEAGVLAPTWPVEYGGRNGRFLDLLVLAEELARAGVPPTLHFLTVQIVGGLILLAGDDEQKRRLLPPMAAGELFACVLFTERDVGSDLASVATRAHRSARGWIVEGVKTYNLKSSYADFGLCALRTGEGSSRYEGLTLALVPMRARGVRVHPIESLGDEQFHEVELDAVEIADADVIGAPGEGWSLISAMFAGERSGLDYYVRGARWLDLATGAIRGSGRGHEPAVVAAIGRHRARLDAGRWLALDVLQRLEQGRPDVTLASLAKWHCSETSQAIAWWALEVLGSEAVLAGAEGEATVEAALRDAPGMTISGGASEVLLETIAGSRLEALGAEGA
jgi:alkylation response protein AidB-like acyl-CoA dehydrogenase